jgi:multidrug efflux pump subunit AcrA (membrane-fusion protein)
LGDNLTKAGKNLVITQVTTEGKRKGGQIMKKKLLALALALIVMGGWIVYSQPQKAQVAQVQKGDLSLQQTFSGQVQRDGYIALPVMASGSVISCVQEGTFVNPGDTLAVLDTGSQEALKQAEAARQALLLAHKSEEKTSEQPEGEWGELELMLDEVRRAAAAQGIDYALYNDVIGSSLQSADVMAQTTAPTKQPDTREIDRIIAALRSQPAQQEIKATLPERWCAWIWSRGSRRRSVNAWAWSPRGGFMFPWIRKSRCTMCASSSRLF